MKHLLRTLILSASLLGCGDHFARDEKSDVPQGYSRMSVELMSSSVSARRELGRKSVFSVSGVSAGTAMLYIVDQGNPSKMIADSKDFDPSTNPSFNFVIPYGNYTVAVVVYPTNGLSSALQPSCDRYQSGPAGNTEVFLVDGSSSSLILSSLTTAKCLAAPFSSTRSEIKFISCADYDATHLADMSTGTDSNLGTSANDCSTITGANPATPSISSASIKYRYLTKNNLSPGTDTAGNTLEWCPGTTIIFPDNTGTISLSAPNVPYIVQGNFSSVAAASAPYYRFPFELSIYTQAGCANVDVNGYPADRYRYVFPFGLNAINLNSSAVERVKLFKNDVLQTSAANSISNNNAKAFFFPAATPTPRMSLFLRRP